MHDSHDDIVALTLVSLSHMIPVLGSETVIGTERKQLLSDPTRHSQKVKHKICFWWDDMVS